MTSFGNGSRLLRVALGLALAVAAQVFAPCAASAGTGVAFGPEIIVKQEGPPLSAQRSFNVSDTQTPLFLRCLSSGLTQVEVDLNGLAVIRPGNLAGSNEATVLVAEAIRQDGQANVLQIRISDPGAGSLMIEVSDAPLAQGAPPAAPIVGLYPAATAASSITLMGQATGASLLKAVGPIASFPGGPVTVPVQSDFFMINVPLAPNRLNDLFLTSISNQGVQSAPTAVAIVQDSEPPFVRIDFPVGGAQLTSDHTDVAGRVSDRLSGFMGLTVKVNGVPAEVDIGIGTNGTFFLPNVALQSSGDTLIQVVATDMLGNTQNDSVTVGRATMDPALPSLSLVSGNGQTAPISTVLPQPVVVRVLNPGGSPFADKLVLFKVTRSDGRLGESPSSIVTDSNGMLLQARTDQNGFARAYWRLGGDAGCGTNRLEVTSAGIEGTVNFCATTLSGPPVQINIGSGNGQRGEVLSPVEQPLRAYVHDGCNGVSGVPVTFTVTEGGGKVNGQDSATIPTGPTGHAQVFFKFGPSPGTNVVRADFPNNPTGPAEFVSYGLARRPSGLTSFVGVVLDNASQPIQGALCELSIEGFLEGSTETDIQGQFRFDGVTRAGRTELHVDGSQAFWLGGPDGGPIPPLSFPSLHFNTTTVPGAENSMGRPILLPRMNPSNAKFYSTAQQTILTVEEVDGLRMTIEPGSMRLPNGQLAPNGTLMALNQVHHDDVPMPMPDGAAPPFAWTVFPPGAHFDPPIKIEYPNMTGLPAGSVAYFLSFDHDTSKFEIVSTGTVKPDGSSIVSDQGSGLTVSGWGCNCPPYSVTADCCEENRECATSGSIGAGTATVDKPSSSVGDTVQFTVSGASDSGGTWAIECPGGNEGSSTEPIPASQSITYSYTVVGPNGFTMAGTGDSVSLTVMSCGTYTAMFMASVERDCAPPPSFAGSASTTVVAGEFSPSSVSVAVSAPPALKARIEQVINQIPNVNISLDSASVSATRQVRDCCLGESSVPDGDWFASGTASLTGAITDVTIWGPPSISRTFDFGFAEIEVIFQAGVVLDWTFSTSATVGVRTNECVAGQTCGFGSATISTTVSPSVTLEAIGCAETFWTSQQCIGLEVTPAAISIGLEGSLRYNSPELCDGFGGDIGLSDIVFSASFAVNNVGVEFQHIIWP